MSSQTDKKAWQLLQQHYQTNYNGNGLDTHLPKANRYIASMGSITLDYSEQCLDDTVLQQLMELAQDCGLSEMIKALFAGQPLNVSSDIPALHTALRAKDTETIMVDGQNVVTDVVATRKRMQEISDRLRKGQWLGYTGKPIKDVVNVGIGGSFLGVYFCLNAFEDIVTDTMNFHFISEIDQHCFDRVVKKLNPETTLFIISSKSFTTQETLANMEKALAWFHQPQHIDKHFIAVTEQVTKPLAYGIKEVLPIWTWVGGRYSVTSAINLMTCIAIGYGAFEAFLAGARAMDEHFQTAPFHQNIPVLLGMIGVWNNNFLGIDNLLILCYSVYLQQLIPYVQQLDMESNGKSTDKQGHTVDYATGPIIWGGVGDQVQHSYYQLLCQGTHRIAADLVAVHQFEHDVEHQLCEAHKLILSRELPDKNMPSDPTTRVPLNQIVIEDCSPKSLGSLIALYEHKIFVQSVIWNINPFDQPGVDSSKRIVWNV